MTTSIGPVITIDLSPTAMAIPPVAAMTAFADPVLPVGSITSGGLSPTAMAASPSPP